MKKYICDVCGYEEEFEGEIPADFICPVCGVTAEEFSEVK